MKVKAKLDVASIKNWIFEHGEKVAFGFMVVVFLLFVVSGFRRESMDAAKQPDKLQELAGKVTSHVQNSVWDEKNAGVQVVNFEERAKLDKVSLDGFPLASVLNPPVIDPKGKREDPKILDPEDIRLAAGVGPFALKGAEDAAINARPGAAPAIGGGVKVAKGGVRPVAGSLLKSQPWAMITALVPVDKQKQEFDRVFSNAIGQSPDRDTPHYAGVIVERAEITNGKADDLKWEPLAPSDPFEAQWQEVVEDPVPQKLRDPKLTRPLGPLVGSSWGSVIVHPKLIIAEAPDPKKAVAPAGAAANQPAAAPAGRARDDVEYKLLRVFDYTVQAMHRYRYRVKLQLKNPNYQLAASMLKRPDNPLNTQEVRAADEWAVSPGVVMIPSGYDVLAAGVEAKSAEPTANLLLTGYENGIPAATTAKLYRGSLANKKESKVKATDPTNQHVISIDEVDFKTSMVVVDIYGGRNISLPKRRESPIAAPGEVLLLDANGNLVVHNDLEDHQAVEQRKPPEEEVTRAELDKSEPKGKRTPRVSKIAK